MNKKSSRWRAFGPWLGRLFLGPCFFFDLVRSARKGRTTFVRVAYAGSLLIVLYLVHRNYLREVGAGYNTLALFAERFVWTILSMQIGAVLILTPAYVAGSITEEKENRTFDMLLTTQFGRAEIVLGKLFSRLAQVAAVLLASLPIMSLAQMWGGIDFTMVLAVVAFTGLTLLSVGSISIAISSACRSSWAALVLSYVAVLIVEVSLLCGAAIIAEIFSTLQLRPYGPSQVFEILLVHAVLQACVILFCLWIACAKLGREPSPDPYLCPALHATSVALPPPIGVALPPGPDSPDSFVFLPPIKGNPLVWKETYVGDWLTPAVAFVLLPALAIFLGMTIVIIVGELAMVAAGQPREILGRHGPPSATFIAVVICMAALMCLGAGFRATGSVIRERQEKTLDDLLAMPIERLEILWAKWWGSIRRTRWLAVCLGVTLVLGMVTRALHPGSCLLFLGILSAHIAFIVSLGLWLSVVARSRVQANFLLALAIAVLCVAVRFPSFWFVGTRGWPNWLCWAYYASNPIGAWWHTFGYREEYELAALGFAATIVGSTLYVFAAWLLWLSACRRFARCD